MNRPLTERYTRELQPRAQGQESSRQITHLDNAFVKRLVDGDLDAMGELYDTCAHFVDNYLQRDCRWLSAEQREDVVQEAFTKLANVVETKQLRVTYMGALMNFLYLIARNIAIDIWRKQQRNARDVGVDIETLPDEDAESIETALDPKERDLLISAIANTPTLNDRQRFILSQIVEHGKSQTQIAQEFGIPRGSVGNNLFRAIQRIREHLNIKHEFE